jgi:hypothetical protein
VGGEAGGTERIGGVEEGLAELDEESGVPVAGLKSGFRTVALAGSLRARTAWSSRASSGVSWRRSGSDEEGALGKGPPEEGLIGGGASREGVRP